MSQKQQRPQTAPEVQVALTQKLIGNRNEDLNTGSSSITSSQIISGNMFRIMEFGEWLKQHHVNVDKSLETLKAGTAALTTKIEPGGQRGSIVKILAPNSQNSEQPQQQPQQARVENE
jgi:hypothetical protein